MAHNFRIGDNSTFGVGFGANMTGTNMTGAHMIAGDMNGGHVAGHDQMFSWPGQGAPPSEVSRNGGMARTETTTRPCSRPSGMACETEMKSPPSFVHHPTFEFPSREEAPGDWLSQAMTEMSGTEQTQMDECALARSILMFCESEGTGKDLLTDVHDLENTFFWPRLGRQILDELCSFDGDEKKRVGRLNNLVRQFRHFRHVILKGTDAREISGNLSDHSTYLLLKDLCVVTWGVDVLPSNAMTVNLADFVHKAKRHHLKNTVGDATCDELKGRLLLTLACQFAMCPEFAKPIVDHLYEISQCFATDVRNLFFELANACGSDELMCSSLLQCESVLSTDAESRRREVDEQFFRFMRRSGYSHAAMRHSLEQLSSLFNSPCQKIWFPVHKFNVVSTPTNNSVYSTPVDMMDVKEKVLERIEKVLSSSPNSCGEIAVHFLNLETVIADIQAMPLVHGVLTEKIHKEFPILACKSLPCPTSGTVDRRKTPFATLCNACVAGRQVMNTELSTSAAPMDVDGASPAVSTQKFKLP